MDIINYSLREKYDHLKKFCDRLPNMKDIIEWDRIKPLLSDLYKKDTEKGGRPNFDPRIHGKDHVPPVHVRSC